MTNGIERGRWKPYPAYKPSGVEWLGDIPAHWEVKPLKRVTACLDGRRIPLNGEERALKQGVYPYWGANSIVDHIDDWLFDEDLVLLGEDGAPFFDRTKQVAFFVTGKCWVNNHAHVLRPLHDVNPKFLANCLNGVDYSSFIDGSTRDKLTQSRMSLIPIQHPPVDEQRAIAAFLDRETAKLDALIAKHERLIVLLQEKRTALISHAVTQGLDPCAPMKDSGVPWLGKVPVHWNERRLKTLTSFVTSGSRGWAQYYSDDGALFIRIGNLTRTSINLDLSDVEHVVPPQGAEVERTRVQKDDVLISVTAYIGSVAVVTEDIGDAYVNQHIALTRPRADEVDPRWLGYCLLSRVGQGQFRSLLYGGTKEGLGLSDVTNLMVIVPTLDEQKRITAYLDRETAKLDALIARVREGIEKLREYRAALISAAVTGKIDVRQLDLGGSGNPQGLAESATW
jgi:type I restriction enzyme S subunit